VVVLTSSDRIQDVNLAYQLGANSFLVKPVDFERFVEISQALKGYWMWLSKAPEVSRPAPAVTQVMPSILPQVTPPEQSPPPVL
jgi:DNA-binding NarL/FixJ family response regulator